LAFDTSVFKVRVVTHSSTPRVVLTRVTWADTLRKLRAQFVFNAQL